MHELSLAEGVRDIVAQAARAAGAARVRVVVLEIGELAAVEVAALRFCLDLALRGSVAEGARIDLDIVPGSGWCDACARGAPLHERYDLCPQCGGPLRATGGTGMRVKELELG